MIGLGHEGKRGSRQEKLQLGDEEIAVEIGIQKMHRGCGRNLYMLIEF